MSYTIHHGDCLNVLRTLDENSVDSIVTDPPYGLSFMGKAWDHSVPNADVWAECLRVLKPGGHLLAFAGTRTQHRMAVNIEDAGFDIRDMIAWVYGSGFPKSLDVSKAIGKAANADEAAKQWQGWGTALKPALEPITVARKPLIGTVASNVLEHGTGAINVGGCRVGTDVLPKQKAKQSNIFFGLNGVVTPERTGRWPANFIHDGSDEAVELLGDCARYFYCAKASKKDRDDGLQEFELKVAGGLSGRQDGSLGSVLMTRNHHPTVKPTDLMRYLVRLVTPSNGTVLDPFMGSGSTGKGAVLEGFDFIGIELDAEYIKIAGARIDAVCYDKVKITGRK